MYLLFETSPIFFFFSFIFFFFFLGGGGDGVRTKLQCIYHLVTHTDLYAAKGISTFQTSLL